MKRRALIITGITSLIVLVAGGWLYHQLNTPAAGVVEANSSLPVTVESFDFTPVEASGRYASFTVPKALEAFSSEPPQSPTLESFNYRYRDTTTWRLAITITDISHAVSGTDSGNQLRSENPTQYAQQTQTIQGTTYHIFTDTTVSGFSKVAYTNQNGKQADISLTGSSTNENDYLNRTFMMVLGSWQWY